LLISSPATSIQAASLRIDGQRLHFALLLENGAPFHPSLEANNSQMNFFQMHEHLRQELLRRIQRGTLSVTLLTRQTGLAQSHLSNFLRKKSHLSVDAMDRILHAQHMAAADLLPAPRARGSGSFATGDERMSTVPIVSYASALSEPVIHPSAVLSMLPVSAGALQSMRTRAPSSRRAWERFVAIRIPPADALPMEPLILPEALAVIDRHYNSLMPYRPSRPTIYAVRVGARLSLRYLDFLANRLMLRPHNIAFPIYLLEIEPGGTPNELIAGRVALVVNQT
jgi:hypothetical protein